MRGKFYRIKRTIEFSNGRIVFTTLFDCLFVEVFLSGNLFHSSTHNFGLDDPVNLIALITKLTNRYLLVGRKGDYYTILIDREKETCVFTIRPAQISGIEILYQLTSNKYSDIVMNIPFEDINQIFSLCYQIAMQ